ncbi:hypothetical protein PTKIN_Ptkin14bG0045600 [Pterospermum kingtungense]
MCVSEARVGLEKEPTQEDVESSKCSRQRSGRQSRVVSRKKKKTRKRVEEIVRLGRQAEDVTTENSVSDEDIEARNRVIRKEAILMVDIGNELGFYYKKEMAVCKSTLLVLKWWIGTWDRGKQRAAKRLLRKGKFQMMFLQETKMNSVKPRFLRWLVGSSYQGEFVEFEGRSGGLMSRWDSDAFIVNNVIKSGRYILLIGTIKAMNLRCGFGNV